LRVIERNMRQRIGLICQRSASRTNPWQDCATRERAVSLYQINRDRGTQIHDNRRSILRPQPVRRHCGKQPVDPHARRLVDAHFDRKIMVRQ
jgi:hypothetical protein